MSTLFDIAQDGVQITSDDAYTPRWVFDAMGLQFDLDVASPPGGPWHVPTSTARSSTAGPDGSQAGKDLVPPEKDPPCIDTRSDTRHTGHVSKTATKEPDMTRNFTTDTDIRDDVDQALQGAPGYPADYDIHAIVREIVQTVGIDGYADMDQADFWAIVARHDTTQA